VQILIKNKKWIVLNSNINEISRISNKFNISPLIASVIINRGITNDDDISNYLSKDISLLLDPFLLTDMDKAVLSIKKALNNKTKIAVYGDYDVDGITATYIVYDYLNSIGANVIYYIPDRSDEGYGVNISAIDHLKEKGVGLIITVDVGITAVEETKYAKNNGIDIIITDHHTPKEQLPQAIAVINPKTNNNKYPNSELAGVGVAFKLVCALANCDADIIKKYSEVASIGTIADMVPLSGENRIIASYGLGNLKSSKNVGLCSLMKVSGIDKSCITSSNISFGIAPRLNAAGRVASARTSVELLLENNSDRALLIAERLDEDNKVRQSEEFNILKEAEEIIEKNKLYNDNVIVVAKEGWHHGVIGIVSSKITEKYYKPSTVISINDDGTAKASGRSIAGFNLFDALSECSHTLIKFGGHDLAAGFSLNAQNIDLFRKTINNYADKIINDDILTPKLNIDAIINPSNISCAVATDIEMLEPFGIGNKVPIFCVEDAVVSSVRIHKSGKHAFLTLNKNHTTFDAPAFNMANAFGNLSPGEHLSIAGMIKINSFKGTDSVQFVAKDIKMFDNTSINDDSLRCVFMCIKESVARNIFKVKLSELKDMAAQKNCIISITNIKICLKIFEELELVFSELNGENIYIKRGKNFYSKCNLEDSEAYNLHVKQGGI